MKKIEVIYPQNEGLKNFLLDSDPFLIGKTEKCQYIHPDASLDVSVVIQKIDSHNVVINCFDSNIPFIVNQRPVKQHIIKGDTAITFGEIQLWITFEEEANDSQSVNNNLNKQEKHNDNENILNFKNVEKLPKVPIEETIQKPFKEHSLESFDKDLIKTQPVSSEVPNLNTESSNKNSVYQFRTKFDTQDFRPVTNEKYSSKDYTYSNYIELNQDIYLNEDNSPVEIPSEDSAIKLIYMENGVVLNERYFKRNIKKIFISNIHDRKNYFQVHNFNKSKGHLIFSRNGNISIHRQNGFHFHKSIIKGKFNKIEEDFTHLNDGDRIILTRGTTQIIIKKDNFPPTLKKEKFFKVDSELSKYIGSGMLLLIPLILIMTIFDVPEEKVPKKEVVVIYKMKAPSPRKQVQKKKENDTNFAKSTNEKKIKETNKKVLEKIQTMPIKKISKKQRKKTLPKRTTKISKSPIVRKKSKTPVKTKQYKFKATSKFSALLGNTLSTVSTSKASKTNISDSMGKVRNFSNSNNVNLNSQLSKIGKVSVSKNIGGSDYGNLRGLSSKKGTNFAEIGSAARVLGAIDPEIVRKLLREHIPYFRSCYQKELRNNESLEGVFKLNFIIDKSGKGRKVEINTFKAKFSSKGLGCMQKVVKMIQFPKPKGGGFVEVRQPLNFYSHKY